MTINLVLVNHYKPALSFHLSLPTSSGLKLFFKNAYQIIKAFVIMFYVLLQLIVQFKVRVNKHIVSFICKDKIGAINIG